MYARVQCIKQSLNHEGIRSKFHQRLGIVQQTILYHYTAVSL